MPGFLFRKCVILQWWRCQFPNVQMHLWLPTSHYCQCLGDGKIINLLSPKQYCAQNVCFFHFHTTVYTKKVFCLHKKGTLTTQKRYFDYTKKVFWLHKKGILTTQKRYFDYRTKIFWLRHRTECNTILIRHCSSHILVNNIMYSTWRHLCLPWHNLSLK